MAHRSLGRQRRFRQGSEQRLPAKEDTPWTKKRFLQKEKDEVPLQKQPIAKRRSKRICQPFQKFAKKFFRNSEEPKSSSSFASVLLRIFRPFYRLPARLFASEIFSQKICLPLPIKCVNFGSPSYLSPFANYVRYVDTQKFAVDGYIFLD